MQALNVGFPVRSNLVWFGKNFGNGSSFGPFSRLNRRVRGLPLHCRISLVADRESRQRQSSNRDRWPAHYAIWPPPGKPVGANATSGLIAEEYALTPGAFQKAFTVPGIFPQGFWR